MDLNQNSLPPLSEQTQREQHLARLYNNIHFSQSKDLIFSNISSTDKLLAYSLGQDCQSVARTKHLQVLSFLNQFKQPNVVSGETLKQKVLFQKIMQNRVRQSGAAGRVMEYQSESNESEMEEEQDDYEGESQEDLEAGLIESEEIRQQNEGSTSQPRAFRRQSGSESDFEDDENWQEPESDEEADFHSAESS